jgi:hypothetical protein
MSPSPVICDVRYEVVPLTVQSEGDVFLVGSPQLGAFYQFPPEAVEVLDRLRAGATPDEIRVALNAGGDGDELDIGDFIATLEEIG